MYLKNYLFLLMLFSLPILEANNCSSCPSDRSQLNQQKDVAEILRSLFAIQSRINILCSKAGKFSDEFNDLLIAAIRAGRFRFDEALEQKLESIETLLAEHDKRLCEEIKRLKAIITKHDIIRIEAVDEITENIDVQSEQLIAIITQFQEELSKKNSRILSQLILLEEQAKISFGNISLLSDDIREAQQAFLAILADLVACVTERYAKLSDQLTKNEHDLIAQIDILFTEFELFSTVSWKNLGIQLKHIFGELSALLAERKTHFEHKISASNDKLCLALQKAEKSLGRRIDDISHALHESFTFFSAQNGKEIASLKKYQEEAKIQAQFAGDALRKTIDEYLAKVSNIINQIASTICAKISNAHCEDKNALKCGEQTVGVLNQLGRVIKHTIEDVNCDIATEISQQLTDLCTEAAALENRIVGQNAKINNQLAILETSLSNQLCAKLSRLERNQIVSVNNIHKQQADFETNISNHACSKIAHAETTLIKQNDNLQVKTTQVQTEITNALEENIRALETILCGYGEKTSVKLTQYHEFSSALLEGDLAKTTAALTALNNKICVGVSELVSNVSIRIHEQMSNFIASQAEVYSQACQCIANFRAEGIIAINSVSQALDNYLANLLAGSPIFGGGLASASGAILDSMAALNAGLVRFLIAVCEIDAIVVAAPGPGP